MVACDDGVCWALNRRSSKLDTGRLAAVTSPCRHLPCLLTTSSRWSRGCCCCCCCCYCCCSSSCVRFVTGRASPTAPFPCRAASLPSGRRRSNAGSQRCVCVHDQTSRNSSTIHDYLSTRVCSAARTCCLSCIVFVFVLFCSYCFLTASVSGRDKMLSAYCVCLLLRFLTAGVGCAVSVCHALDT